MELVTAPRLSVLDLAPVASGSSVGDALHRAIDVARHVESLGYHRYWVAEHHNMPGIASSSPAVLLAHAAMATSTIRLGSGGVMLPNHAPLTIAEQFGMLEALHPGRIDLGLGRAPGTDGTTARALRGTRLAESDDFPARFAELMAFFDGSFPENHPYARIAAVPGLGSKPAIWLLGSSDFGAQMAGQLGLPFTFAHHFGMGGTELALDAYRRSFHPSVVLAEPYAMIGVSVVCAPTDDEAVFLAGASALGFLWLRQGRPSTMPTPEQARDYPYTDAERAFMDQRLRSAVIGSPSTVRDGLAQLVEQHHVDELMITTSVHGHTDRLNSFRLVADALDVNGQLLSTR
jgi:luciferase family oxidoreductase group 1